MRSSTGRWVVQDDFFDRQAELELLESRVRDGNHVLLTGQRRMGKTSLAQELGRRLGSAGWEYVFTDVEAAKSAEDVIAEIAEAVHPVRPISSRLAQALSRWVRGSVEEVSAMDFRVKIRAGLDAGSWRRHGDQLLRYCAEHHKPVLLVIDELPIFLKRIERQDNGVQRVDDFLSWLRRALLVHGDGSLVTIISGSIGLAPLVEQLGLSDRINNLDPFRLGPWSRRESIACFTSLADHYGLDFDAEVPGAVYDALGIGIPHHVQSFFARLRDFATMSNRTRVTAADVRTVYRNAMLGPSGQNDLVHYETRLKDGLDEQSFTIAMEVLAEASVTGAFSGDAERCLESLYSQIVPDTRQRITAALGVLVHDGYLEASGDGYTFPSKLLADWWLTRFHKHHVPLCDRVPNNS